MSQFRTIQNLAWAAPTPKPDFARRARPKGAKAEGLRYERACAKALPGAEHGPWFRFEDQNGLGYCSPDLVLRRRGVTVVFECKLANTIVGQRQIMELYAPVLHMAFGHRVLGVVITRSLARTPTANLALVRATLAEALELSASGAVAILHWLGHPSTKL